MLIVRAISFQDFHVQYVIVYRDADRRYRRTDRPDMQSQDCALHYSTSRGKTETKYWYRRYYRYCRYCIIIDIID